MNRDEKEFRRKNKLQYEIIETQKMIDILKEFDGSRYFNQIRDDFIRILIDEIKEHDDEIKGYILR